MSDKIVRATIDRAGEVVETDDVPKVGEWFYVNGEDYHGKKTRWLACCVHVGSNYAALESVQESTTRIHFDKFWETCERVDDPDAVIDREIASKRREISNLMNEVRDITARLGVSSTPSLTEGGTNETRALSIRGGDERIDDYKAALVKAKDKQLPALFEQIKDRSRSLASWMAAKMIPLKAEAEMMQGVIGQIKKRIFSVELYAGLTEQIVEVLDGPEAPVDTKIHLMQRRCYMDEECLARYETGGMAFKEIDEFDAWMARPENFKRLLPFPRTVVAFRVRRNEKYRAWNGSLKEFLSVLPDIESDKWTFLYIRNGEKLLRLRTAIEFDEKLFPDLDAQALASGQLYAKMLGGRVDRLVSEGEYQQAVADDAEQQRKYDEATDEWEKMRYRWPDRARDMVKYSSESVYYDDITKHITNEMARHNRLVLVLQGLLDRSPVFAPHPPWQLWTHEGFTSALDLVYDDSRALVAGDKPDFEAYRARLNSSLKTGSITVGQQVAWELHEGAKEARRMDADHRVRGDWRPTRHKPYGNPGPGTLAKVHKYAPRAKTCTYAWERERLTYDRWNPDRSPIPVTYTTSTENVLNVDAYKPGDFRKFFDDPRTRAEYLKWAPLLLEAEEFLAGNRTVGPSPKKK